MVPAAMGSAISGGVAILRPETFLLYKAHECTRKDDLDFRVAPPVALWQDLVATDPLGDAE
jgi:hypothetical protein